MLRNTSCSKDMMFIWDRRVRIRRHVLMMVRVMNGWDTFFGKKSAVLKIRKRALLLSEGIIIDLVDSRLVIESLSNHLISLLSASFSSDYRLRIPLSIAWHMLDSHRFQSCISAILHDVQACPKCTLCTPQRSPEKQSHFRFDWSDWVLSICSHILDQPSLQYPMATNYCRKSNMQSGWTGA